MKKKLLSACLIAFALIMCLGTYVAADTPPYDTYTYSINGYAMKSPAAYAPLSASLSAQSMTSITQKVEFGEQLPAAEVICGLIASADAGWYDGSEEFAQTMETCRKNYPTGPAAHLLNVMETEHQTYLEQKQG